jgi:LPS-assembly lipoprotein
MKPRAIRLVLAASLGLALSACGFRPLYGRLGADPGAQQIFASVYVEPIDLERVGYELRNSMIDILEARATPQAATYRLQIVLQERQDGAAVQNQVVSGLNETTITRYNYTLIANYALTDAKGAVVTKGVESTLSAYNVVSSPYATLIAQQDAQKRAADDIAYRLRTDLGVFFAQKTGPSQ